MWDLQGNGGSVAATTERILGGRGLERVSLFFFGFFFFKKKKKEGGEEEKKRGKERYSWPTYQLLFSLLPSPPRFLSS